MTTPPGLGQRAIKAYNRLARDVAAYNYILRVAKPGGTIGETSRRSLSRSLQIANRLCRREPGQAQFALFDPVDPMTLFDFALYVARLSAACSDFEERYAHLTQAGIDKAAQARRHAEWGWNQDNT
jgi:hypothetical protein